MNFKTLSMMILNGQFGVMLQLQKNIQQFYRAAFIATALEEGIYAHLRHGPANLEQLSLALGAQQVDSQRLGAWLVLGVALGELKLTPDGYALRSRFSRQLAKAKYDPQQAILQETVHLHHSLLTQTPARLRQKRLFSLADSDGELIARSSRILEAFVFEAVEAVIPVRGNFSLLEVGCGSGVYIRHACQRNPALNALGLELQPEVAVFARKNVQAWGLEQRVRIECGDVRNFSSPDKFDLLTLHNNIYYFPQLEWMDLARHLMTYLKPGGRVLFTSGCQGGGVSMQVLNLWGLMTDGAGPLPEAQAFFDLLRQAGFQRVMMKNLLPGDSFYMFVAEI